MSTSPYTQFFPKFPATDLFSQPGVAALRNVTEGTFDAAVRLAELQIEAAQAAMNENAKQFRTFLQNTADTSTALSQWSVLFQASAQRFNHMAKYYIESASQDVIDWNRWLGQSVSPLALWELSAPARTGAERPERRVLRDRRVEAQLITFPERRASELAKAAAEAAAESARQATGAMGQGAPEAEPPQADAPRPEEEAVPQEQLAQPAAAAETKPQPAAPPRRGGPRRKQ